MFPEDFVERKQQLIKAGVWRGDKVALKFLFGNLHSMVENPKKAKSDSKQTNSHRWIMFIAL